MLYGERHAHDVGDSKSAHQRYSSDPRGKATTPSLAGERRDWAGISIHCFPPLIKQKKSYMFGLRFAPLPFDITRRPKKEAPLVCIPVHTEKRYTCFFLLT